VPTAHHGRRSIAVPTAKPVLTPAYTDGDVPTVAIYANGRRLSAPYLRPIVSTRDKEKQHAPKGSS
jgi:hypothetical protein